MTKKLFPLLVFSVVLIACSPAIVFSAELRAVYSMGKLQAPAGERPTAIGPAGETILPNARLITPRGTQVKVAPHPYGLALRRAPKIQVHRQCLK